MKALRTAFSFLTILPLAQKELKEEDFQTASLWFPLVGYFLGGIYWGIGKLLMGKCPEALISFLILVLMTILTGALHLDGLADWADSLGGKNPEQRLKIMKDPHKGSFGTIALVLVLLGKFLCVSQLLSAKNVLPLFFSAGLSRFNLSLLLYIMPYARSFGGTAEPLVRNKKRWHLVPASIIMLVPLIVLNQMMGWFGLAVSLLVSLIYWTLGMHLVKGFTGDLLGACAEVSELVLLLYFILYSTYIF